MYLATTTKALESAIDRKEAYEQQLADAWQQQAAETQAAETQAVASAPPVTASVLAAGSDRIQLGNVRRLEP